MPILLHKQYAGTEGHMVISDGMIRWTSSIPEASHYVIGCPGRPDSLEPLLKLYGIEVPDFVPEKFRKSFAHLNVNGPVPWRHVLPKKVFRENFKKFVTELCEIEKLFAENEYPQFFVKSNQLFSNLTQAHVDTTLMRKILQRNDSHVLKKMLSGSVGSYLDVPSYDRVSTKTGRLTIKKGPQVLTLKKEFRSVFTPAGPKKKLYEIDFVSLEPRVALNFAGVEASSDVYLSFIQASDIPVSRDTAKLAVLCSLYGAGQSKLEQVLRKDNVDIRASYLIKKVSEYFKLKELKSMLRGQAREGMILNYFGRPIEVDNARESILVNNYLQSTATDVAIAGFNEFTKAFANKCNSLFVIHDALIVEVEDRYLADIRRYVDKGYEVPDLGNFPLKLKEFTHHE